MAVFAVFAVLIFLTPCANAKPEFTDISIPSMAESGQPIRISVNLTSAIPLKEDGVRFICYNQSDKRTYISPMTLASGNLTSGAWEFEVPAQEWKTQLNCRIEATDISGSSSIITADIDISGASPPRDIPWGLIIMVGFLAIAFILTELAFKPGTYRPTGRQRSEILEEEDRERELKEAEEKKD